MKKFLLVTIIGFAFAALAAVGAPQPLASPVARAQAECDCSKLKDLQLELRNAIKLQQAFTGKIAELRGMNRESAAMAFADFAKSAATTVTRPASDKGPAAIDYISRGDGVSPDDQGKVTGEGLCRKSDNAELALRDLDGGASCAGIAKAVHAHEDYHQSECSRLTFMVYREKHPADRAAEEAAAYGEQIKVLREIIARLRCGYRAAGKTADVAYSGLICSLDEPFTITGTSPLNSYPFRFIPTSTNAGTVSFDAGAPNISMEGSGSYKIEGADTGKPRIAMTMGSVGHTPIGSRSGGGTVYIDLVPLEKDECKQP